MKQRTLAMMTGFERYATKTRRAAFLEEMEQVVPWAELCALIEPYYPKAGNGRPPVGLERMLRVYFLQQWFNLSDPGVEEVLYDSAVMRQFVGISAGTRNNASVCRPLIVFLSSLGLARLYLAGRREALRIVTLTFGVLYCFLVIGHDRRKILHCNVTR